MKSLPQLIEEDIAWFDKQLRFLLDKTNASAALIVDQGGFVITSQSRLPELDVTTVGALASGTYLANQTIAGLVQSDSFNSVCQQGQETSMLIISVDDYCLLIVIFKATVGVGLVKYFAGPAIRRLAVCLAAAQTRNPGQSMDLSVANLADPSAMFTKKP